MMDCLSDCALGVLIGGEEQDNPPADRGCGVWMLGRLEEPQIPCL